MKKSATLRRIGLAGVATTVALGTCFGTVGTASAANGFAFDRIAGADRYETSALTATAFGPASTVIIASGEAGHYADALTASYLAGLKHAPVLLVKKDEVPAKVLAQIKASGATKAYIVGGTDVVSETVTAALVNEKLAVTRLSGDDRYDTAAKVIDEGDKAPSDTAVLATGQNFPDALGGGPLAYAEGMPLAITRPAEIPAGLIDSLKKAGVSKVLVLGGTDAVSDAVVSQLAAAGITLVKRIAGSDRAETSALLAEQEINAVKDGGLGLGFDTKTISVASGAVLGDGADALGAAPLSGKAKTPLLITKNANEPGAAVLKYLGDHAATLTDGTLFGGTTAVSAAAETQMVDATGSGQVTNTTTHEVFSSAQAAIDDTDTKAGDVLQVTGSVPGFTVTKAVKVEGQPGAKVLSAIRIIGVDGVSISSLSITPSDVAGQVAGVYLDNAEGAVITGNTVVGTNQVGAGVINATGGDDEKASINDNTFRNLLQGVFANPTATFDIEGNTFQDNLVGSANDTASTIKGNTFLNNDLEGVGLGATGSTVTGNSFANNPHHVSDYTAKTYDLTAMSKANTFDEEVQVVTNPVQNGSPSQWIADVN